VWVPAVASLASAWVPAADLREPRALPVLVIAGRDDSDLAAAVAALADDLADAEVVVTQQVPAQLPPFEARTVVLLNRGVPSFAVDIEGTLHTALMRSCTGWPSGTWIDEPRRSCPDGSSFQLQHWTHDFDYALVADHGDWRRAAIPARSAGFSHPLLAVPAGARAARLPAAGSLLHVEPASVVQLGALKAAGNPLARGRAQPVDPATVAMRLVETHGADTGVSVGSALGTVSGMCSVDLLESPRPDRPASVLHGYQVATVTAHLDMPEVLDAGGAALAPEAEAAQPLYARYWLHNRGPAPLGGLPAVAYLHPHTVAAEPGCAVLLRLTAASDCTDTEVCGTVTLVCPHGWASNPGQLPVTLRPGEYRETDVVVAMPPGTAPGLSPIRAQLRITGDGLPCAWRQVVEDVCTVAVDAPTDHRLVYLVDGPTDVELTAGARAHLSATVGTDAHADLAIEAHLISPWGTWDWIAPGARGAVLPARGTVTVGFDVTPPVGIARGQWWALIRVGCAGQLLYSPAVKVRIR
jgi:alpha-mannosidase